MEGLSPEDKQCWSTEMLRFLWQPTAYRFSSLGPTDTIDVDIVKDIRMFGKPAPMFFSQCYCQEKVLFAYCSFPLHSHPNLELN